MYVRSFEVYLHPYIKSFLAKWSKYTMLKKKQLSMESMKTNIFGVYFEVYLRYLYREFALGYIVKHLKGMNMSMDLSNLCFSKAHFLLLLLLFFFVCVVLVWFVFLWPTLTIANVCSSCLRKGVYFYIFNGSLPVKIAVTMFKLL